MRMIQAGIHQKTKNPLLKNFQNSWLERNVMMKGIEVERLIPKKVRKRFIGVVFPFLFGRNNAR